jgi:hypothetical protein
MDPSIEYARTLRHLQAPDARCRAEKTQSTAAHPWLGTQGVGGSARRGPQSLFAFRVLAPDAWAAGERRGRPNASASLTGRHRPHIDSRAAGIICILYIGGAWAVNNPPPPSRVPGRGESAPAAAARVCPVRFITTPAHLSHLMCITTIEYG